MAIALVHKNILVKNLIATNNFKEVKHTEVVIFVTETPVDENHNRHLQDVLNVISDESFEEMSKLFKNTNFS